MSSTVPIYVRFAQLAMAIVSSRTTRSASVKPRLVSALAALRRGMKFLSFAPFCLLCGSSTQKSGPTIIRNCRKLSALRSKRRLAVWARFRRCSAWRAASRGLKPRAPTLLPAFLAPKGSFDNEDAYHRSTTVKDSSCGVHTLARERCGNSVRTALGVQMRPADKSATECTWSSRTPGTTACAILVLHMSSCISRAHRATCPTGELVA